MVDNLWSTGANILDRAGRGRGSQVSVTGSYILPNATHHCNHEAVISVTKQREQHRFEVVARAADWSWTVPSSRETDSL